MAALMADHRRSNSELARAFAVNWHTVQLIREELQDGQLIAPYQARRGRPPKLPDEFTPSEDAELSANVAITVWVTASSSYRGSPVTQFYDTRFDPEMPDREGLRPMVEELAAKLLQTWIDEEWPLKRSSTLSR